MHGRTPASSFVLRRALRLSGLALLAMLVAACESSSSSSSSSGSSGVTPDGGTPGGGVTPDELLARGGCADSGGAGTDHAGFIESDETWTAAGSPHRVTSNVRITATLTIEPCAVVEMAAGTILEIGSTSAAGKLVAKGSGTGATVKPVTIKAADPSKPWTQLQIEAKATAELTLVTLVNGGLAGSGEAGALLVRGVAGGTNDGDVTRSTTLDRVLVEKSASYGINLEGWGALTEASANVWVRGSGSSDNPYAVRIEPGIAGTLPKTLVVEGNVANEIAMRTSKAFMRDDTLQALGIPYRMIGPMYVSPSKDGAGVTLTIEPGVTLGFDTGAGSGMVVGSSAKRQGVLVAEGTADKPIVFTSAKASKAPGDWSNIDFRYTPLTGNKITNAKIEYAGGESGTNSFGCGPKDNDSAIIIQGQDSDAKGPGEAFVTNTTFEQIAGTTVIVSGWTSDSGPNFAPTNTFGGGTPSCKVSRPKRSGAGDVCDGGRDVCWSN